jgi:hypothetical protein
MQAIATPLTPEAKSYEVARPAPQPTSDTEKDTKGVLDNIREKLNLDQPIAPSTKKFIESVKDNVGEAVTPAREAVEKAADLGSTFRLELRPLGRCALSPPATVAPRARLLHPALSNRRS